MPLRVVLPAIALKLGPVGLPNEIDASRNPPVVTSVQYSLVLMSTKVPSAVPPELPVIACTFAEAGLASVVGFNEKGR